MSFSTPIFSGLPPCAKALTGIAAPRSPSFSISLRFIIPPQIVFAGGLTLRPPVTCGLLSRASRAVRSDVAVGPLEISEALAGRVAGLDDRPDQDGVRRGGDHLRHPAVEHGQSALEGRGACPQRAPRSMPAAFGGAHARAPGERIGEPLIGGGEGVDGVAAVAEEALG